MPWLNSPICAATLRAQLRESTSRQSKKWLADELASTGILSPGGSAHEKSCC